MSFIRNYVVSKKFKGIPRKDVETMKVLLRWMMTQGLIEVDGCSISLGVAGIALTSKRNDQPPDMNQIDSLSFSKAKTLATMALAQIGKVLKEASNDKIAQMIYTVIVKLIRCYYAGVDVREQDLFPLLTPPMLSCCCISKETNSFKDCCSSH